MEPDQRQAGTLGLPGTLLCGLTGKILGPQPDSKAGSVMAEQAAAGGAAATAGRPPVAPRQRGPGPTARAATARHMPRAAAHCLSAPGESLRRLLCAITPQVGRQQPRNTHGAGLAQHFPV